MSAHLVLGEPLSDENRQYLIDRGLEAEVERYDAAAGLLDEDEELDEDTEPVEDYSGWKKAQLVAKLEERELDTSGNVDTLRARLMESDALAAAEAEGEEDPDE